MLSHHPDHSPLSSPHCSARALSFTSFTSFASLTSSKPFRIRTSKTPLPQLLYNPHLQAPLGSAGNKGLITPLESALTKNSPATLLESALTETGGWGPPRLTTNHPPPSLTFATLARDAFSMTRTYLEAAIEIAQEAGKILIEEFSRPVDIRYKGDEVDLVTQADKRSEQAIVSRLTKYFPEHAIAAEEGTGHESASASEFRWHVDPLDGTTNFAHGYPCFCVSIALAQRDTLLVAVVFNPFYNELFTAARGEGATFNGTKIHVSKNATLSTSLLCTGFPVRNRKASPNLQYYGDFTQRSHGVRRDGSAALDLASVAAGRFDGFWEFGLQKWDVAAGVLLIREAGGKVTDFAGNPYQLGGSAILATNGLIHEEMRAVALEISQRVPAASQRAKEPLQS